MGWRDYWNSDTPIYVSARHKAVHYEGIARDIVRLLSGPKTRVLDYACGEALSAGSVADNCAHLFLSDGAALVRDRLRVRFAQRGNVTILSPEELDVIEDQSIDLVVVSSLLQYLSRPELDALLPALRRKLTASGRLVIADVIPRKVSAITDATALLRFAAANGFLISSVLGLARTALSDYRRTRAVLGLSHYDEAEFLEILRASGFNARRLPQNIGHNPARMAFEARLNA